MQYPADHPGIHNELEDFYEELQANPQPNSPTYEQAAKDTDYNALPSLSEDQITLLSKDMSTPLEDLREQPHHREGDFGTE